MEEKKYDAVALGELLIDFTQNGTSEQGNWLMEANPGGAPCNVLAMLTKLGKKTSFIGKVGNDMFGKMLCEKIKSIGIGTENLVLSSTEKTTLAFVHTAPDGDRSFSFYRNPGADASLEKNEISEKQILDFKNRLIAYGFDITYFDVIKNFENDFVFEIGIKDNKYDKVKDSIKYIGDTIFESKISTSFNKDLNHSVYIKVFPEIKLDVLYGFGTISSEGNNICGDNYLIKELNNGKFISAISDGMGKGYSAFCESNMTLNLVEDVIKLNLDSATALEILNSFYAIVTYSL